MSNPRRHVPGATHFITRRTTRRYFLLNPDKKRMVWAIYWYVTALLAEEYGIEIHAVQILSNHIHEVLTDKRGLLSRFLKQRNRLFANALKVHLRWPEEVFARGGLSCEHLYGSDAILEKIAYTLANVVVAGLALNPEDWPSVTHAARDIGARTIRVRRPDVYFDPSNKRWPPSAEISLTVPEELITMFGTSGARERIVEAVTAAVVAGREAARKAGRRVKSVAAIFATKHTTRASSYEPKRTRNASYSAGGNAELGALARHEHRTFLAAYRAAMKLVKEGRRDVVFPLGTSRMHHELGFSVAFAA